MKKYSNILSLVISVIISIVFLNKKYGVKAESTFNDFALGTETKAYFAKSGEHSLQAAFRFSEFDDVLKGWFERKKKTKILWLGNSQLHAINQLKAGDKTSIEVLHENILSQDLDVVAFSLPNACVQEHYIMYEYVHHKSPCDYLIMPIFFDDLREDYVRTELFDVPLSSTLKTLLEKSAVSPKVSTIISSINNSSSDSAKQHNSEFGALKATVQDKVERHLDSWLTQKSIIWEQRPNARGEIMTSLYVLRNTILGIKPTTKRRMIKSRYDTNMKAFQDIIESTKRNNTKLIIYIPPIRSDVESPYDIAEYNAFKIELINTCKINNINCLNLENLVPAQFWGTKDATTSGGQQEIDFMHFQAAGHRLLGEEMTNLFLKSN